MWNDLKIFSGPIFIKSTSSRYERPMTMTMFKFTYGLITPGTKHLNIFTMSEGLWGLQVESLNPFSSLIYNKRVASLLEKDNFEFLLLLWRRLDLKSCSQKVFCAEKQNQKVNLKIYLQIRLKIYYYRTGHFTSYFLQQLKFAVY